MKGFNSIGDLSRFAQLRQANHLLKTRLSTLTDEMATGQKSDITAATGGNLGRLAQVENRLTVLESYNRNASVAQTELNGLQAALTAIGDIAAARGPDLQIAQSMSEETALAVRTNQASQDFQTIVRLLNVQVGGRFLLSGSDISTPPLLQPDEILNQARAHIAGLADPADISAALGEWFETEFAATAFNGNSDTVTTGVSPEATTSHSVTAIDPAFRAILKGLATAALAGDPALGLTRESRAVLLGSAGRDVSGGNSQLTSIRARVGMQQALISEASARNASEVSALSIARSDILAADPYETASALTQAEASLQNLYSVTARLSRLSLTDYL